MSPAIWQRDVRVPLRECDYQTPIKVRTYPFIPASRERELDLHLAARIVSMVPYWRRFKLWPDQRATTAAYAEMRRLLLEYGYSEKDFEQADFVNVTELIAQGHCRKSANELRTHLGGTWDEYRQCIFETVGRWISDRRVLDYWRKQVDALRQQWREFWDSDRRNGPPCPIGGLEPRPLKFPDHLPAIYAGIARLHDRFNNLKIITPDLEEIGHTVDGKEHLISLPTFNPGTDDAYYGNENRPVDLWMIRKFIEIIRNDLHDNGLLDADSRDCKSTGKTGSSGEQKRRGRNRRFPLEDDRRFSSEWEQARDSGVSKARFCEDKGTTPDNLNRCLARVRKAKRG